MRLALPAALSLSLFAIGCPSESTTPVDAGSDTAADTATVDVFQDAEPTEVASEDVSSDTEDTAPDTSVEPTSDWTLRSIGDEGVLSDLFALSTTEAYAVGGSRIIRFNGEFWASFGDIDSAQLHGVWASQDLVVAVGDNGTVVHRAPTELSWTTADIPTTMIKRGKGKSQNRVALTRLQRIARHRKGMLARVASQRQRRRSRRKRRKSHPRRRRLRQLEAPKP